MYRVIHNFRDAQDGDYIYMVGDNYPRKGVETTLERATALMGDNNAIGCPLIKEVEIMAKPVEPKEEKPKRTATKGK